MTESLVNGFLNIFSNITNNEFGKILVLIIISMLPILELRGGLIASALLDVNPVLGFIVCVIANIIPIPFILWFITPLFRKLKTLNKIDKFVDKLERKALKKKEQIEKYEFLGILLFVGIPLPGTGAWTGSLIAALLDMNKKKSFVAAICGVIIAGLIMGVLSYSIKSIFWYIIKWITYNTLKGEFYEKSNNFS